MRARTTLLERGEVEVGERIERCLGGHGDEVALLAGASGLQIRANSRFLWQYLPHGRR
jgi:hypothetical protein